MSDSEYKVSVYSSKLGIPLNFVVHTHIVTEHNGIQNRYDVFAPFTLPKDRTYHGTIVKNFLPPTLGFLMFFRMNYWHKTDHNKKRWAVELVSCVSGVTSTSAHTLFQFIENGGLQDYPYFNNYRLIRGPNSNTFTQWVVDQVPECNLSLPWSAWGKGYKK